MPHLRLAVLKLVEVNGKTQLVSYCIHTAIHLLSHLQTGTGTHKSSQQHKIAAARTPFSCSRQQKLTTSVTNAASETRQSTDLMVLDVRPPKNSSPIECPRCRLLAEPSICNCLRTTSNFMRRHGATASTKTKVPRKKTNNLASIFTAKNLLDSALKA